MVGEGGAPFWRKGGYPHFLQCLWDGTMCVFLREKGSFATFLGHVFGRFALKKGILAVRKLCAAPGMVVGVTTVIDLAGLSGADWRCRHAFVPGAQRCASRRSGDALLLRCNRAMVCPPGLRSETWGTRRAMLLTRDEESRLPVVLRHRSSRASGRMILGWIGRAPELTPEL